MVWQKNTALGGRSWTSRPVITLLDRNECFCDAKTKPLYCREIAMQWFDKKTWEVIFQWRKWIRFQQSQIFQAKTFRDRESFVAIVDGEFFEIRKPEISGPFPSEISFWRRSLSFTCVYYIYVGFIHLELWIFQKKITTPCLWSHCPHSFDPILLTKKRQLMTNSWQRRAFCICVTQWQSQEWYKLMQ